MTKKEKDTYNAALDLIAILGREIVAKKSSSASPACYGVWHETKKEPPPLGVWCVGRKGRHRPFTFRATQEGKTFKTDVYLDADNCYRDPDRWQAIAP